MDGSIKHQGKIERIAHGVVSVRLLQYAACSSCSAAKLCNSSESKEKVIDVRLADTSHYAVGQTVVVEGSIQQGLRATLWAYVVPLVMVVLVLGLAVQLGWSDGLAALCSLGVLVLYYLILYMLRKRIEQRFTFSIV